MKLQVGRLPKNNKNPLLVSVDYDPNPEGDPSSPNYYRKTFIHSFAQGSVFEVDDLLGGAILAKYPGIVRLALPDTGVKEGGRNKMLDNTGKQA